MLTDGIQLLGTSAAENLTIASGSSLPVTGNNLGEIFYLTTGLAGLYVFSATGWKAVGTSIDTTSDLPEGTNLYFTNNRALTAIGSTTNVPEGTNLYFTNNRALTAIGSTTNVPEGTNLYFTNNRALTAIGSTTNVPEGTNLYFTNNRALTAIGSTTNVPEGTRLYYTDARSRASVSVTGSGGSYDAATGVITLTSGAAFPTQTGNSGKFLTTDGSITSWGTVPAPLTLSATSSLSISGATTGVFVGRNNASAVPGVFFVNNAAAANARVSSWQSYSSGQVAFNLSNDAQNASTDAIVITRSGNTASNITFNASALTLNAAVTGTSFAGDGSALSALNAAQLTTGTVSTTRLGTGTANTTTYLRGDGTWAGVPAGTLSGTTLAANVVTSSLTSVGTLASLVVAGNITSAEPTASNHLTTKNYVDTTVQGLTWKTAVKAASTANLTLSGLQSVDGLALIAGDRVLVKNQSTASQNGIYIVQTGAWTRALDADTAAELDGAAVFIQQGTVNAETSYTQNATIVTVGTDTVTWAQFASAGGPAAAGSLTGTTLAAGVTASSLTSVGTITSGTWSGLFGAVSGANLTALNASNLASGTVGTTRLGSGTADTTTYLRGDGTWATVAAATTATNIAGGAAAQIPYQTAAGATAFSSAFTWTSGTNVFAIGTAASVPAVIQAADLATGTIAASSLTVRGGDGGSANVNAGALILRGGDYTSTAVGAAGANVQITGGSVTGTGAGAGGNVLISGGTTAAGAAGGFIAFSTTSIAGAATERFRVRPDGAWSIGTGGGAVGTSGQVLVSAGAGAPPAWGATSAAAAGSLTGTTLAAGVTASSLTSVGTLASLAVTGAVTAGSFSGTGTLLTTLNAANLSTGNVSTARLGSGTADTTTYLRGDGTWAAVSASAAAAGTLTGTTLASNVVLSSLTSVGTITSGTWSGLFGAVSGANLTSLNASNLASGTVGTTRLGSGTADTTTYLRGDGTWATVAAGTVTSVGVSSANGAITIASSPVTSSGTISLTANTFTSTVPGVVPGSGGGTTNFLRADGTWATVVSTTLSATGPLTYSTAQTGTAGVYLGLSTTTPYIALTNTSAAANNRASYISAETDGTINIVLANDAVSSISNVFKIARSGNTATNITLTGTAITLAGAVAGTSFAGDGSALSALNAAQLTTGTVSTTRLGTGTANSGTFLRGDGTWAAAAGGGTVTSVGVSSANAAITIASSPVTSSGTISLTANTFTTTTPGVVPGSGGGTTNFLRADGTWAAAGGGGSDPLTLSAAGPQLTLNNGTSNTILFGGTAASAPAFTTRAVGTKVVLLSNIGAAAVDYALGIESSTMWLSVPTTAAGFKFYAGTTSIATLSGGGLFTTTSFAGSGVGLTALNAGQLTTGTVGAARLGSGTANTTTFLRGDGSWASVTATSATNIAGGVVDQIPFQSAAGTTTFGNIKWDATNRIFSMGASPSNGLITITTPDATTGVTAPLLIQPGTVSTGTFNAGAVTLNGGATNTAAAGGAVNINGGAGGASGGAVIIRSGVGPTTNGAIQIIAAGTTGSNIGGAITLTAGSTDAGTAINGGALNLNSGSVGSSAASGNGGALNITSGGSSGSTGGNGGTVAIAAGGSAIATGGAVTITAGGGNTGGNVTITGGSGNPLGGNLILRSGAATATGGTIGGDIVFSTAPILSHVERLRISATGIWTLAGVAGTNGQYLRTTGSGVSWTTLGTVGSNLALTTGTYIGINGTTVECAMVAQGATVDQRVWAARVSNTGVYSLQTLDDTLTPIVNAMQITRSGTSITTTAFNATTLTTTGTFQATTVNVTGTTAPANGMYLSAANTLALSSNTTARMTINSTGVIATAVGTSVDLGSRSTDMHNTVAAAASTSIDLLLGNAFTITMGTNITTLAFTNPPATGTPSGRVYTMRMFLTQDGVGGRTITWPASVKWPGGAGGAPTLSAANKTDIVELTTKDGGANWFGEIVGLNY